LAAASLRARYSRSLDLFVAPADRASPEDRRRARFAIGMSLALTPVMAALSIIQFASGNPEGGLGSAAIGAVLAAAPIVYRRTGRLGPVVHGVLGFAWVALLAIAITSRGPGINAATVGLAELPIFAVLLTGLRGGAAWAAIVCASDIGLAALGRAGRLVEHVPQPALLFVEYSALLLITLTLFAVGVMYEMRRTQSLREVAEQDRALREAEQRSVQAETDARLAHAEKLASIGRVTAAVAHEINNPLSYLGMNLRFIRDELGCDGSGAEVERALADSLDGVSRIAHLVARLRGYARGDADAPDAGSTDLSAAVDRAVKVAEPHTRGRAAVRCEVEAGLPPARGQEGALVLVFVNLIANAAQALPEERRADNRIDIRAARSGDWLVVEVRDNGSGIPGDVMARLGEPFFTTKPIGEGTGLGLAVSKSTLRAIGGKLEFESEPGRTVARVLLPVSDEVLVAAKPQTAPHRGAPGRSEIMLSDGCSPGGPITAGLVGLRILIVDDDERVARSLQRVLTGHEITAVSSGQAALEVLDARTDFDLILCDLMMPGMTGMELYERLERDHPEVLGRVVFSTGGAFTAGAREFCERHAARVLPKPVSVEALRRVLVEAAGGRAA
jgi:signal transduction histidine kinase/CheY-like chemotaxis protein